MLEPLSALEREMLDRLREAKWTVVAGLDEGEKALVRALYRKKYIEFHNGVVGLPVAPEAPEEEKVYESTGGLRREVVRLARAAKTPAAAVADLAKFIWGWDRPNWPLYGKFGGRFGSRDQLALFCLQKAVQPMEGDPIKELLRLAVAISDEPTKEEIAARRREIEENAAYLARLKAGRT
jgi:hypothetical protein